MVLAGPDRARGAVRSYPAYYERVERAIDTDAPLEVGHPLPPLALVPIRRWDRVTSKTLRWAIGLAPEVVAVQVLADERPQDDLADRWPRLVEEPLQRARRAPPRLVVLRLDSREFIAPLVAYIARRVDEDRCRQVAVVLPQRVEHRWYHALVPFDLASVVRTELLARGRPQVVIVSAPSDLQEWMRPVRAAWVPP